MRQTFEKLIVASVILVNSQLGLANKSSNYPAGFKPKSISGVVFTENKGQIHDQNYQPRPDVLFTALAGNMAFHLKTNGVSYQLYRLDKYKEVTDERTKEKRKEIDQQTIYRIDLNWLNVNANFSKTTDQALEGCNNYYLESCPNGALNVKSYTGVTLNNLFNGINLHYYEKGGQLKHDYIVAPNTDYKQIQLKVEGASISISKDGSLLLATPLGKVQEGAPIAFQNGKTLKAKWKVNNNTLSFEIENYDPSLELIIDPVTRLWGTYYGGSGTDFGLHCTTDAAGDVYMSGQTDSNTGLVIATTGAHQTSNAGLNDAYLVKFNPSGVRQWATYYGGTGSEAGNSCVTDATGNVYMAGQTASNSGTVMTTTGAHQTVFGGGSYDFFLVKFNSSGVRQWGTLYGGSGSEMGSSCAVDATGNVYLAGYTDLNTGTVIATVGAHQTVFGGISDVFLVKFNSSGVRQWGTLYGGINSDYGSSCATDASGNVYLAGSTDSNLGTVIATTGAHQPLFSGGGDDAFLVKFNSSGVRQWGTYYGGTGFDKGISCATDATGNVYMAGHTDLNTGTVIATVGAHQTVFGGSSDAYLVKFNSNGVRLWGTYYGGTGTEYDYSCTTDAASNVYLAGITSSSTGTVIATSGAHQTVYGGMNDAFLVQFNSSGIRQWATYYGGSGVDRGHSCATDVTGNVYLVGMAGSYFGTAIATAGAHQSLYGGGSNYDAFLVKFHDCVSLSPNAATSPTYCTGATINLSVSITGTASPTYSWAGPNSYTAAVQNPSIANAGPVHIGTYIVTITNGLCVETATTLINSISPCTGITQIANSSDEIIIFPNPFNNKISIISNGTEQSVQVYNALGSAVYNVIIENEKTEIDLTQQASGIYFVRIGSLTKKLVKE